MISFSLDCNWDVQPEINSEGLYTLQKAYFPLTNRQLVPLRLFSNKKNYRVYQPEDAINWDVFLGVDNSINNELLGLLPTFIRSIVINTEGVTSVDLSNAKINISPGLTFENICYTVGCDEYTL